jgi:hypothetical protein
MQATIDEVMQAATKVVDGEMSALDAMPILRPLAGDAVPVALALRKTDPVEADDYHRQVLGLGRSLRQQVSGSKEASSLNAVIDDLSRVLQALG